VRDKTPDEIYLEDAYKKALTAAYVQLGENIEEQERLEEQRKRLSQTIASLSILIDEPIDPEWRDIINTESLNDIGFTDAVRAVLKEAALKTPSYLHATEVRDSLMRKGYELTGYSNALATIHNVLKRLVDNREIEAIPVGTKTAYKWKQEEKKNLPERIRTAR
jgi:hypothetical protein